MRLALILLYTSGLRRGELLRLKLEDWDASQALLRIESTKFHKSRLLPLSPSAVNAMNAYLLQRHQNGLPMDRNSALIWNQRGGPEGKPYSGTGFLSIWYALCSALSIRTRKGKFPRIHDIRHTFAIRALQVGYQNGENVQAKLPLLSTYMGHVSIASTYYYLTWVEGIRNEIASRFQPNFRTPPPREKRPESFGGLPEGGRS